MAQMKVRDSETGSVHTFTQDPDGYIRTSVLRGSLVEPIDLDDDTKGVLYVPREATAVNPEDRDRAAH